MDTSILSTLPSIGPDILQPAMPSIQLALKHYGTDDYFQQLLSFDSALEALDASKEELLSKMRASTNPRFDPELVGVKESVRDLKEWIEKFEALQLAARHSFNLRARSLRKVKKGILDLPNELLHNIFGNFRGDLKRRPFAHDSAYKFNTVDIQNIRLAHRKFLQPSSHLLIRYLNIAPTASSLERLENIMRHPEISQGQRLLRLDLRYYNTSVAEDLQEFAVMCYDKLGDAARSLDLALMSPKEHRRPRTVDRAEMQRDLEREIMTEGGVYEDIVSEAAASEHGMPEDMGGFVTSPATSDLIIDGPHTVQFALSDAAVEDDALEDMVTKVQRILSSWEPFVNGAAADEDGADLDEAVLALLRGHERYRALLREQNEMLQGDHFVRAVAAALARGHSGGRPNLWLYMSDDEGISYWNTRSQRAMDPDCLTNPDLLVQSHLIKRSAWFDWGEDDGAGVPQWLLYQLPLALHTAGVALAGLKVKINGPFIFNLNMTQDQLSDLREVAKTLGIFEFELEEEYFEGPSREDSPETLAGFYAYVAAAMGQQGVPLLSFGINPPESCFELGPLLTSPSWQRLELAHISGISMDIQDLKRLVGMLQPRVCLQLESIHLTSGTWAAALDCLRSNTREDSYVDDCRGAECDVMPEEEYNRIFMADHCGAIGKATLYITSQIHKNPLRNHDLAIEATPEV